MVFRLLLKSDRFVQHLSMTTTISTSLRGIRCPRGGRSNRARLLRGTSSQVERRSCKSLITMVRLSQFRD